MTILSADSISLADFQEVLTRYQPLIDALSDSQTNSTSKKGKSKGKGKADETELGERKGELTLKELDVHRLVAIPARLEMVRKEDGELCLRKEEVEKLIRWKLCVLPLDSSPPFDQRISKLTQKTRKIPPPPHRPRTLQHPCPNRIHHAPRIRSPLLIHQHHHRSRAERTGSAQRHRTRLRLAPLIRPRAGGCTLLLGRGVSVGYVR